MKKIAWLALVGLLLLGAWSLRAVLPMPPVTVPAAEVETEASVRAHMRQVLGRDDILPIYQPRFVSASSARYRDDELVLGVSVRGQSKAYDISTLNAREMVVDWLAGTPILVTW